MFAKLSSTLFLLPAVLLSGAGCDSNSPSTPGGASGSSLSAKLVGAWETEPEQLEVNGKKQGDPITLTFHFKADGGFQVEGFLPIAGTWKAVKEEGNTLTILTEISMPEGEFGFDEKDGKKKEKDEFRLRKEQKTFTITFDGPDAITMTDVGDKPQPTKLKRKK